LAVLGFITLLIVASQLISGMMLALSFIPEVMLIAISRDEEDIEDLYTDDFFWIHERGVDMIFLFSYAHLLRKLFMSIYDFDVEASWKSGVFTFLIFQVVVFFGLSLCATHLSEITLTIAANILHTFFMFKGKAYWWIFTNKELNTDTIIRLAYIHYIIGFYMFYLGVVHSIDMHYDWKNETVYDGLETEMVWWDEALSNELSHLMDAIVLIYVISLYLYEEPEALSYEIFMWGDVGLVTDVRYYSVAPHWYFRPFMAWLIACPYHRIGVFGLVLFFIVLFYQPGLHGASDQDIYSRRVLVSPHSNLPFKDVYNFNRLTEELNLGHQLMFGFFVGCLLYVSSYLPYGRFYNRLGGNIGMLLAYIYVLMYLTFPRIRRSLFSDIFFVFYYKKVYFISHLTTTKVA
jgi:quinol-cytochrome oxidoreductase complex cytochrome b subunit